MNTLLSARSLAQPVEDLERAHRKRLAAAWLVAAVFTATMVVYGASYYLLGAADRPYSPKHALLRPSGSIGIKLGILGTVLFFGIYFYYFRKRWGWLRSIGMTKHWLDFHIVMGVTAPIIIACHAAFKFRGIAGMAFWIMVAVAVSGIVGRYLYSQIPRHLNAAELSWQELKDEQEELTAQLATQKIFVHRDLSSAFRPLPTAEQVRSQNIFASLVYMFSLDLSRPFRVAALRRRALRAGGVFMTVGGLFSSGRDDIERVVQVARRQAALTKRMVFLSRSQEVFQLWHVVHRPFSYAFLVLAILHISAVFLLGYL
ncbi:MAG: hypothetical protein ACRD4K_03335 [Candidatus Acidiferrales bacterium]